MSDSYKFWEEQDFSEKEEPIISKEVQELLEQFDLLDIEDKVLVKRILSVREIF